MIDYRNFTVADIVLRLPQAVSFFEKYHIDFCCKGKLLLSEACDKLNVDTGIIEKLLNELSPDSSSIPADENMDELVDFIMTNHHAYFWNQLPILKQHMVKVLETHGEKYSFLSDLKKSVDELLIELEQHMLKEEHVLFPYFRKLSMIDKSGNKNYINGHFLNKPISTMETEHDKAGELLEKIRKISSDFTTPESDCTTFRLLYSELEALEKDLHQHIFIENTIIFPKGLLLEKHLISKAGTES